MTRRRIASIARFASLLFSGVFAGFLLTALVIELSLRQFDGSVYTRVQHVLLLGMPALASATLLPALVAAAVLAIVAPSGPRGGRILAGWAFGLLVVAFVVSMTVNVPVNARELGWSVQEPPSDWSSVRDGWQLAHLGRTVAAFAAFVLLTVAAIRRPWPTGDAGRAAGSGARPSSSVPS